MIRADEMQNAAVRIPFSIKGGETLEIPFGGETSLHNRTGAGRPRELNISGSQVLVGCLSVLCILGTLLHGLIKLWPFAP